MEKEEIDVLVDLICDYALEKEHNLAEKLLRKSIERAQDEGFMKGYEYAIKLLQESLVKCDKE